jgi:type I restriction enzyme S subunit
MSEEASLDEFTDQSDAPDSSNSEVASENWSTGKVKNHAELISGAHVKSGKVHGDNTSTPYLTGPEDFEGYGFEVSKYTDEPIKFCEPNDTLVTVKGSGCGKTAFSDRRACISRQLKALRPESSINPLYLYYYTKSKKRFLGTLSEGSAIPGLSNSHLTTLDIPVPELDEQRKIATVLYTVDQAIQKTEEIIGHLNRLQKGTLRRLFKNGLEENDVKDTPMGRFPEQWELKQMEEVGTLTNGNAFPKEYQGHTEGKYPFVKVSDTNDYRRYVTGAKNFVSQVQADEIGCNIHPENTVILPKRGAAIMTNKRRILAQESAIDNNQIGIMSEEVQPLFLYYYLSNVDMGRFVQDGAVKSLTKSLLAMIQVPVPPWEVQTEIAETLDNVDKQIEAEKQVKSQYERLKQGLMQDLLSGAVRTHKADIDIPEAVLTHG